MIEILGQVIVTGFIATVLTAGLVAHVGVLMLKCSKKDGE